MVQEIFGVNGHIRSVADRYAAAGYLAIAPAIFDRDEPGIELGYTPEDIEVGRGIAMGSLDFQNVLADVAAAGVAAREAGKVGVVGYCFGGRITAACAIELPEVFDAASSYYGGGVVGLIDQTPGRADDHALRRAGPRHPHGGRREGRRPHGPTSRSTCTTPQHGFNCDHRASFSAVPAAIAQARTFRFFDEKFG